MTNEEQLEFEETKNAAGSQSERILKVAKRLFKTENPTSSQVAETRDHVAKMANRLMEGSESTHEEATEEALQSLEEDNAGKGGSGQMRDQHFCWVKDKCLLDYKQGKKTITAKAVFIYAIPLGYQGHDARGIGDSLGRGGLRLEPKTGTNPREYIIPDPEEFADWYAQDHATLPRSYYSHEYWKELVKLEGKNPRSRFIANQTPKKATTL